MISPGDAARFDVMVQAVIADLPTQHADRLAQLAIIVLDRPDAAMLAELGIDANDDEAVLELCGLHTGVAITETSVEDSAVLPSEIHIFREGVLALAGGFGAQESEEGTGDETSERDGRNEVAQQIRITLLHEIGHQFGLDEGDLLNLGYE